MRRQLMVLAVLGLLWSAAPLSAGPVNESRDGAVATVAVPRTKVPAGGLRDEAAMVLVGTALIAIAAAVRRVASLTGDRDQNEV